MKCQKSRNSSPYGLLTISVALVSQESSVNAPMQSNARESLVIGTEEEAAKALEELRKEAINEEGLANDDSDLLFESINPSEPNDLDSPLGQAITTIDFSLRPSVTFMERHAISEWFENNKPYTFDPDDVEAVSYSKIAATTWELVPHLANHIMYGDVLDKTKQAEVYIDKPYCGPVSSHPLERYTTRVYRGRFDALKERGSDHVYPEFTELYRNKLDPEVSVFLISDQEWNDLREKIIHPKRTIERDGEIVDEYFYPIPIPHDFDMAAEKPPTEDEEYYGVHLKQYLDHPYDWYIFRAPLTHLRQDEVDRIVHIAQSMVRKHKARVTLENDIWSRFSIRLTAKDHAVETMKNLEQERKIKSFFRGRWNLSNVFHCHHKKMRADKIIKNTVEKALSRFHPDDVARQRKYMQYLEQDRLDEEIRIQQERHDNIANYRANVKWYLAPYYLLKSMMRS